MKNKGFTLAELLIVVAIIAVLVGISIPVFTNQLEKSREATDLANVRSAYAKVMVAALANDTKALHDGEEIYQSGAYMIDVELKQTIPDWSTTTDLNIGGVSKEKDYGTYWLHSPLDSNTNVCSVIYNPEDNSVTIDWTGGKIAIPHIYNFKEGWNFDTASSIDKTKTYIYVTDDPSIDDDYRHTAIHNLFDINPNSEITFDIPSKKIASKYLDIENYTYSISVDFVDTSKKIQWFGNDAYLSLEEGSEKTIDWGNGNLNFKTTGNSSTKALIDVCKIDKNGRYVEMTEEEIDYIMYLYNK